MFLAAKGLPRLGKPENPEKSRKLAAQTARWGISRDWWQTGTALDRIHRIYRVGSGAGDFAGQNGEAAWGVARTNGTFVPRPPAPPARPAGARRPDPTLADFCVVCVGWIGQPGRLGEPSLPSDPVNPVIPVEVYGI